MCEGLFNDDVVFFQTGSGEGSGWYRSSDPTRHMDSTDNPAQQRLRFRIIAHANERVTPESLRRMAVTAARDDDVIRDKFEIEQTMRVYGERKNYSIKPDMI